MGRRTNSIRPANHSVLPNLHPHHSATSLFPPPHNRNGATAPQPEGHTATALQTMHPLTSPPRARS